MNKTFVTKAKNFLAFVIISSIVAGVSYFIVFKISYLPNGYDVIEVQKDIIKLKSFNILGMEKEIKTVDFSEKDTWKINTIEHEVHRQKEYLWLLFSAFTVSLFLFVYKIRNGMKLWKAISESNLIFSVLLPLFPLINSLNSIQVLTS